jgi:hypothetical protein
VYFIILRRGRTEVPASQIDGAAAVKPWKRVPAVILSPRTELLAPAEL